MILKYNSSFTSSCEQHGFTAANAFY